MKVKKKEEIGSTKKKRKKKGEIEEINSKCLGLVCKNFLSILDCISEDETENYFLFF